MNYNFDLSQEDFESIFEENIFPNLARGVSKSLVKSAYIIGGQPGSGKSAFAQSLMKKDKDIVFINGDDLRSYHPRYVEYLKENDQEAADRTQMVCNAWIEKAINTCLEEEYTFMVEGTMRVSRVPLQTAQKAKAAGYEVRACIISTPYELSLASINARYTEAKRVEGYARYTKKSSHDEAFENLPKTVEVLISESSLDDIHVFKRLDGTFEKGEVDVKNGGKVLEIIESGRNRPLTDKERLFIENNKAPDNHTFPIV